MNVEAAFAATADVVTPVAVVDQPALERNIRRMQAVADDTQVALRPHAKTHKSTWIARLQLQAGAVGLTVATLTEAEVFCGASADDILIAHPAVGAPKLRRLESLAARAHVSVSVDNVQVARQLPASVDVLWEVDSGQRRVGTLAGEATAVAVEQLVDVIGQERFRGLITHAGHVYGCAGEGERVQAAVDEVDSVEQCAQLLNDRGIDVRELSIGSTPTVAHPQRWSRVTEIRPGTYVFGDANQVALGSHELDDCALCVIATVVSTPTHDRAVADAGSKCLSADMRVPSLDSHGIVLDHPELRIERLSEEHCVITSNDATGLQVGDRVALVPAHVCTTVNLNPELLVINDDGATRWEPVAARGWR